MMGMKQVFAAIVVGATLLGCQTTNQLPSAKITVADKKDRPQQFILLGAGQYEGELTAALMANGFKVKPLAVTPDAMAVPGYRYALKVSVVDESGFRCTFSGGHRVSVTLVVVDIERNETLGLIKQSGPNTQCPPLTPVWDLIVAELARTWSRD